MDSLAKFCGSCGAQLQPGVGFCHQCGASAGEAQAPAGGGAITPPSQGLPLPPQPPPSPGGFGAGYPYQAPYPAQHAKSDTRYVWIILGVACGIPALIVVLGIIASISIPFLLGSHQGSVREKARNDLRAVVSAEFAYYASNGQYAATLSDLAAAGMLQSSWASGNLPQGITLTLTSSGQSFTATATCSNPPCTFTADETGEIK